MIYDVMFFYNINTSKTLAAIDLQELSHDYKLNLIAVNFFVK